MPNKVFKQRRPMIEPLEPRLLFSATLDAILLDDTSLDDVLLQDSANSVDLRQVYDAGPRYSTLAEAADNEPDATTLPNADALARQALEQIVFVDSRVEDVDTLLGDLAGSDVQVITLDIDRDGVAHISQTLQQYQNIQTIHVISHGNAGALQLGSSVINDVTVDRYQSELQGWQDALGRNADLLLYGCDLAANSNGVALLSRLGELTGADIAASDDITGQSLSGGDWSLEYERGAIESEVIVSQVAQKAWQGRLADTHYVHVAEGNTALNLLANTDVGQQFVYDSANATYNVNEISLFLARYATTFDQTITVQISDSWDGAVLGTGSINSSQISDVGYEWHSFNLGDTTLNDNQSYYIRISTDSGSDDPNSNILVSSHNSNQYNNATLINGGAANADGWDLAFKVSEEDGVNAAPTVVNAIADQTRYEDVAYSFTVPSDTFSDGDSNDTLRYRAQLAGGGNLDWLTFNPITREFSGTPRADDIGVMSVEVIATDNHGASVSEIFDITINNTNDDPFVRFPIKDQAATQDTAFSFTIPADAFGDEDVGASLSYQAELDGGGSLPAWLVFDAASRTFSGTPAASDIGTIAITVIADDGEGGVPAQDTFDLVVTNQTDTTADVYEGTDPAVVGTGVAGGMDVYQSFVDMDGSGTYFIDTLSIQLRINSAAGDQTPQNINIEILDSLNGIALAAASRSSDGLTDSFTWESFALPDVELNYGQTYYIKVTGDGDSSDPLVFAGIHDTDVYANGSYFNHNQIEDTGRDLAFQVSHTFNQAPVVVNPAQDQVTVQDQPFQYTLPDDMFSDPDDGDTLTYTVQRAGGGSLNWLSYNSATKTISGTPAEHDIGTIMVEVIATDNHGKSTSDVFSVEVQSSNVTPTISNPISDQSGAEDSFFDFTFAANTFTDADGDTLTYTALQSDGGNLPPWLNFDAANRRFYGTPGEADSVTWVIDVFADDGRGGVAKESFNLVIANTNDDPYVENPIPDQTANDNEAFSYTLAPNTFGDSDLDTLNYSAQLVGGGALPSWLSFDSATRTFSGTPASADIGSLDIEVTADDNNGGTPATDTFTLTIVDTNDDPQLANAIADQTAPEDTSYVFQFAANTFNDFDGDTLTYTAELAGGGALPAWLNFDAASRTFSGTPSGTNIGSISITVTADDNQGGTPATETFSLEVTNTNDDPVINNAIANQVATEDSAFSFQFAANTFADEDGDTLTYSAQISGGGSLPGWLSFDATSRTFSGTPGNDDVGSLTIRVTADDGKGGTPAAQTFDIVVTNTNDDPVLNNSIDDQVAIEDSAFSFQFSANTFNDDDGDDLLYSAQLAGGGALPTWLNFDALNRTFSGIPDNGDVGTISIEVSATDNNGGSVATDVFALTVSNTNDGPVIVNPIADQTANEDSPFSFQFDANTFYDADGNPLTYTVQQVSGDPLPSWLQYDAATRTFSGTPENGDVGNLSISVTASDGTAETTDIFDLNVVNSNDDPVLNNPLENQSATEDIAFYYQFSADTFGDDDGDTLEYSAELSGGGVLPFWLTFDAATRTFSGTPSNADVGVVSITVTADDGQGGTVATDSFSIVVGNTNDDPTVSNPISDQIATEDSAFSFQFAANTFADDDGDMLLYRAELIGGEPLPSWLTFDAANRTFNGTPSNSDVGTLSVRVIADDGQGGTPATDVFAIVVNNVNDSPVVNNAIADQSATEDVEYNFQFSADVFSDDDGDDLSYTARLVGGGSLPAWLSFDGDTRTFSGTPLNADVGTFAVEVVAFDGITSVTDTFTLQVNNANDDPVLDNPLADQYVSEDSVFRYQFSSNTFSDDDGDTLTYSAQLLGGGSLPAWLSFDGASRSFSGTPTNADVGTITIVVMAGDGNGGADASDSFNIVIGNTNDDPTVNNPIADQSATEDSAFSYQFASDTFTDDDGDTLFYSAQLSGGGSLPDWLIFDAATRTFSGTPTNIDVGDITVEVYATDNNGGAIASDGFVLSVLNTNDGPTVVTPIADQTINEDSVFSFQFSEGTFSDPDGNSLSYSAQQVGGAPLPQWLVFDADSRTFSGIPTNADVGSISIVVSAFDGVVSSSDIFDIRVVNTNDAPELSQALEDQFATEDTYFNYQLNPNTFIDIDSDTLSYSARLADGSGLPSWLEFDAGSLTFSGIPTDGDTAENIIVVTAEDGNGGVALGQFLLTVLSENDAPQLNIPIDNQQATENSEFLFKLPAGTFIDADGDELTINAQASTPDGWPEWLSYDATNQTFSGTPGPQSAGTYSIIVTADDGFGGELATDTFDIVVGAINEAPNVINPIMDMQVEAESEFTFSLPDNTFSDPDNDALTIRVTLADGQPLPEWLSFDGDALTFSGTPLADDVGSLAIAVMASDGAAQVTDTFVLTITDVPSLDVQLEDITVNEDSPNQTLEIAQAFQRVLGDGTLTFSVVNNTNQSLFDNVTIDGQNGALTLDYALNAFGRSELEIQAVTATGEVITASFLVNILSVNDAPEVTGNAESGGSFSAELQSYPLSVWGSFFDVEQGFQLTYTVTANSNPSAAQITAIDSDTGTLMLATNINGGATYITVRATDNEGAWAEHTLLIDIRAVDEAETPNPEEDDNDDGDFTGDQGGDRPEPESPTTEPPLIETEEPVITQTGGSEVDILEVQTLDPETLAVLPEADDLFSYNNEQDDDNRQSVAADELNNRQAQWRAEDNQQFQLIGLDPSVNTHLSLQDIADFSQAVDESRQQIEQAFLEQQKQQEMIAAVSLSLGTGLVLWALRASSLLFALFSVLPLWRGVDPLPILENVEKKKKQLARQKKDRKSEDSSAGEVGYLFDHQTSSRSQGE